ALVSIGIALGLAIAIDIAGLNNLWHDFSPPRSLFADLCWSGLATAGFAILFNVPMRTLPICVFFGAMGHVVRTIFMSNGQSDFASIEVATYFSAMTIGLAARVFERRQCIPAPIYAIPAVIPMVPGTFAFGTMVTLLQVAGLMDGVATENADTSQLLVESSVNAIKTGLICAALAIGLKTPALLFDRCKQVV
ncbi:MAG: threonine/serine exporter family protein, partial [Pirellulaceae bacterium]|nr:threonine/serine exporter family protein [Pirellulaceae bacterium]